MRQRITTFGSISTTTTNRNPAQAGFFYARWHRARGLFYGCFMTTYKTGNPLGSKDPQDLYDNAENMDLAVNDPVPGEWTDRLGKKRKNMAAVELSAPLAADAADRAAASAAESSASETRAATAAEIAAAAGRVYSTSTAGRDAVQPGQYYWVESVLDRAVLELWKNVGGVATDTMKRTYSALIVDAMFQDTKQYSAGMVDSKAADLFKTTEGIFSNDKMPVVRFMTTGQVNEYKEGTYQTGVPGGVSIAVPASGSNAILHYFNTRTLRASFYAEFTITAVTENVTSGESVGIGFVSAGAYEAITYSKSGNIYRRSNQVGTLLRSGLAPFGPGDVIRFECAGGSVSVYVNGVKQGSASLHARDFIVIAQSGFAQYSVSMFEREIDPIREYVRGAIADSSIGAPSPAYYSFVGNSLFAYSHITGDLYVGFEVRHEVDMRPMIYQDYWRIYQALFYRYENGAMVPTGHTALGTGESEFVFKQVSSKADFTGGYHGDEIITDLWILVDGQRIDAVPMPLTPASTVEYIAKSTMHETAERGSTEPIEGHPVVAYHTKHTQFVGGGYRVRNLVQWNYAGTLSTLYHGISCIHKDCAQFVFTDDFAETEMTGSGVEYFNLAGARMYRGRNPATGLAASATASQQRVSDADGLSVLFVHDRAGDSKYYRKSPGRTVMQGEVHESTFECRFLAE